MYIGNLIIARSKFVKFIAVFLVAMLVKISYY